MKYRTRQVLALVADDLTAQVLDLCRENPRTEGELAERTGAARKTIVDRVSQLEARGLLVRVTTRTGSAGRPPARWGPLADDQVRAFEVAADTFVAELLQAQLDDHRSGSS